MNATMRAPLLLTQILRSDFFTILFSVDDGVVVTAYGPAIGQAQRLS
jgi:hypothetical protein